MPPRNLQRALRRPFAAIYGLLPVYQLNEWPYRDRRDDEERRWYLNEGLPWDAVVCDCGQPDPPAANGPLSSRRFLVTAKHPSTLADMSAFAESVLDPPITSTEELTEGTTILVVTRDATELTGNSVETAEFVIEPDALFHFSPNPSFHPADNPVAARLPTTWPRALGGHPPVANTVAAWVIDSAPSSNPRVVDAVTVVNGVGLDYFQYSTQGKVNGIDGHGTFVTSLVRRLSGSSAVGLVPVVQSHPNPGQAAGLGPARYFYESDLIKTLTEARTAATPPPFVNLSLGDAACARLRHYSLAKELADPAWTSTIFIAAAGNERCKPPDFPAAFASSENWPADIGDHSKRVVGVGSSTRSPSFPDCYSATAPYLVYEDGTQVAEYPHTGRARRYARWSGTSFSAAVLTAKAVQAAAQRQSPLTKADVMSLSTDRAC